MNLRNKVYGDFFGLGKRNDFYCPQCVVITEKKILNATNRQMNVNYMYRRVTVSDGGPGVVQGMAHQAAAPAAGSAPSFVVPWHWSPSPR